MSFPSQQREAQRDHDSSPIHPMWYCPCLPGGDATLRSRGWQWAWRTRCRKCGRPRANIGLLPIAGETAYQYEGRSARGIVRGDPEVLGPPPPPPSRGYQQGAVPPGPPPGPSPSELAGDNSAGSQTLGGSSSLPSEPQAETTDASLPSSSGEPQRFGSLLSYTIARRQECEAQLALDTVEIERRRILARWGHEVAGPIPGQPPQTLTPQSVVAETSRAQWIKVSEERRQVSRDSDALFRGGLGFPASDRSPASPSCPPTTLDSEEESFPHQPREAQRDHDSSPRHPMWYCPCLPGGDATMLRRGWQWAWRTRCRKCGRSQPLALEENKLLKGDDKG